MSPGVKKFIIGSALIIAALSNILIANNNSYVANKYSIEWVYTIGGIILGLGGLYFIIKSAK